MSDDTISRLFARLDAQDVTLARIDERLRALPCDEHHRLLRGNGKAGIADRLLAVETRERIRSRVEWTVGGGIVTLLVTIGAALAVR